MNWFLFGYERLLQEGGILRSVAQGATLKGSVANFLESAKRGYFGRNYAASPKNCSKIV
jgi:hypothetical protein